MSNRMNIVYLTLPSGKGKMHAITLDDLEVKNIASIFKCNPGSIYLVEEIDNIVLFPLVSGRFKESQVISGATYEVHGDPLTKVQTESSPLGSSGQTLIQQQSGTSSPYGAYVGPTFLGGSQPPHPPRSAKKATFRKTITLVSLQARDSQKACSSRSARKVDHSVVTHVYVSLKPSQCTVTAVSDLVTQQVGFEVLLLDSKCYPLLINESTSGTDVWKSTRKVLAASKLAYQKICGQSTDVERAVDQTAEDDEDDDIMERPSKQRKAQSTIEVEQEEKGAEQEVYKTILEKLTGIEKRLHFLNQLEQGFHCCICKCVAISPVVAPCCKRVIGCKECVNSWLDVCPRCPLCSTEESIPNKFTLKGFSDAIRLLRATSVKVPTPPGSGLESDIDDD